MASTTVTRTFTVDDWLVAADALDAPPEEELALAVVWCAREPLRVGELAVFRADRDRFVLGRGEARADDPGHRLSFVRWRPHAAEPTGSIGGDRLSRQQLKFERVGADSLRVERTGRCALALDGVRTDRGVVREGSTVALHQQLVLLCVRRARYVPGFDGAQARRVPFGEPDPHGIVGESPTAWWLRDRLAFLGRRRGHVLILGESGVGKELAARVIHAASDRGRRPMVARNAATLPEGLVDAELFGNIRDYPNPGMPARPGLIGEAHLSTLYLDEIGELGRDLQAHLLRVLDSGGDYQRLGDARKMRADLRLLAATNRPPSALKHDLVARLPFRVEVPGLAERREDIPLLARHMLQREAQSDPEIGERFFHHWDGHTGEPRVAPELMDALVRHRYAVHVRELSNLLWTSIASATGPFLPLSAEVEGQLKTRSPGRTRPPEELTASTIQEVLERLEYNREQAWRELGLSSRHSLYRLMKKYGLTGTD